MAGLEEIKRVVVAVDLSTEHAKRCVSLAASLAKGTDRETVILTVIRNSDIIDSEGRMDHDELVISSNLFSFHGVVKSEFVKSDDVAGAICGYCKSVDADLVIVGGSGRSFLKSALLGSVSEKVVGEAPCSILIAK